MELPEGLDFARSTRWSVLTTIRKNGRPQLSNVGHVIDEAGVIRISITADRAKYKNILRESWVALHVTREDFYAYAVIEGSAELSPVAARADDATVDELVDHYRRLAGEHDNWDEFRKSMVDDRRAVVRITPHRAYGMLQLPQA